LSLLQATADVYAGTRSCFTGEMLILCAGGKKRADAVALGDLVWTRDENDPEGPLVLRRVQAVYVRLAPIWHVELADGQVLRTTMEHPFWVENRREWLAAWELREGDLVRTEDGRLVAVSSVRDTGVWERVYNWEVEDCHTYFVSTALDANSIWAHNANGCGPSRSKTRRGNARQEAAYHAGYDAIFGNRTAPQTGRYVVNSGTPPGLPSYTALSNPDRRVTGLLIFQEGGQTRYVRLTSGVNNATDAGLAGARNLPGATAANWHHVEFQALEIMRQRGITNASLLHNYPTGLPCGACMPGGDLTRLQSSLANGNQLSIFGLTPSPAGSTRSPWMVSPAGSVRVTGTR
jgi:hypothetical protein